jgi:death-on-curing protein
VEILYLSTDQLIAMHEAVLAETGGLDGVRSYHQLASVVGQVQQSLFGEDAYATLADKAAAYAFFLAMNHPFNDGNKRTAVVALDVFLDQHGHLLEDGGELEDVIVRLAAGQMAQGEFFEWVAAHVRALGAPGNR